MSSAKIRRQHISLHQCWCFCLGWTCVVQRKEAIAYGSYACTNTFLPTAVAAVVLYYGGNLVLQGHMSAGALVSFMLYQQSLTSAFQVSPFHPFSMLLPFVHCTVKLILVQKSCAHHECYCIATCPPAPCMWIHEASEVTTLASNLATCSMLWLWRGAVTG